MMSIDHGVFAKLPGFDEPAARRAFRQVIPLKTLVVYCPDPRAAGIPAAVAKEFDEVWPGEVTRDADGKKSGFTNNVAQAIVVGGRAVDALRTITTLNHMLGLTNVVVVHHTFCGTTAFTPAGLYETYHRDHGADLRGVYDEQSLTITDFATSLHYDLALVRRAPGTPKHLRLFGYLYDIDTETLTKIVEDLGQQP